MGGRDDGTDARHGVLEKGVEEGVRAPAAKPGRAERKQRQPEQEHQQERQPSLVRVTRPQHLKILSNLSSKKARKEIRVKVKKKEAITTLTTGT